MRLDWKSGVFIDSHILFPHPQRFKQSFHLLGVSVDEVLQFTPVPRYVVKACLSASSPDEFPIALTHRNVLVFISSIAKDWCASVELPIGLPYRY